MEASIDSTQDDWSARMFDVDQFTFLLPGSRIEEDLRIALAAPAAPWTVIECTAPAGTPCQMCSDPLELGTPRQIDFGDGRFLPVHDECQRTRAGLSSAGCMLALKGGVKLVSIALEGEKAASWKREMIRDFVDDHGATLGRYVLGHGVTWWHRDSPIADASTFTRLARHIFMHEREAPKFRFYGGSVPDWDEDDMAWSLYKREAKDGRGPFYTELKRLQAEYKKVHGEVERKHPPFETVLARTKGSCAFCHAAISDTSSSRFKCARDHILPLTRGGSNEVSNFQPLHQFCNGAKNSFNGGHFPLAVLMGRWLLEQSVDPSPRAWWPKMVRDLAKLVS
jgi:hypothetical protein